MYEGDLPDIDEFGALIVLGGPMNVYEEDRYPYLTQLNGAILKFITGNKLYLGFCLGAQLLAKALGAKIICHGKCREETLKEMNIKLEKQLTIYQEVEHGVR
jgi:GMP synthase (glutamine-hydrolysing)